jgi:hypothetical protein
METRAIVVKNIEVLDAPPEGNPGGGPGGGGPGGGGPGGGDGPGGHGSGGSGPRGRRKSRPRGPLQRFVITVLAVAFLVVVAVPAVVLGGACLIVAIVGAILLWAIRRLAGAARPWSR